jgi:hypothetical protein
MVDKDPEYGSDSRESAPAAGPARQSRNWWLWLVLGAVALITGGGLFLALKSGPRKQVEPEPLDGKLEVIVRPPVKGSEPLASASPAPCRYGPTGS